MEGIKVSVAVTGSRRDQSADVRDPAQFIAAIRHAAVTEMVEALMQGTRLLALTAPAGAGKTTLANILRQELLDRSVSVLWVDGRSADSIDLRSLASQLLDKDTAEFSADDIEPLFDVLTSQPVGERHVLIIDNAERLAGDALAYLRLQSSIAWAAMPQIVLFADPSLWDAAESPTRAAVCELITDRRELRLLDENEAKAFATLGMPESAFGEGALEALARHGEGRIGRITSLLAVAVTIRDEHRLPQLTVAEIEAAASRLLIERVASRFAATIRAEHRLPQLTEAEIDAIASRLDPIEAGAQEEPAGQTANELFLRPEATDHKRREPRRRAALVSALVSLPIVLAAAMTVYWWSAWQPHQLAHADSVAAADTPPSSTIEAVELRPPEPTPLREPDQQASPGQTWVLADLLDNALATATVRANDAPIARQEPRAPAASWSAETAAQSEMLEPPDHSAPPLAETRTTVQAPALDAKNVADVGVSMVAPMEPAVSAITAAALALAAPATAQTVSSEATVPEHVGDVREVPAVRALPIANIRPMLQRGGAMLALGDVTAARLFYERAAALGSAEAATSIGKSYDPAFLASIGAAGTAANPMLAASWYRKAAKLGDPEAARRLATMTAGQ